MAEQRTRCSQNGSRRTSSGRLSGPEERERVGSELPQLLGHPVDLDMALMVVAATATVASR